MRKTPWINASKFDKLLTISDTQWKAKQTIQAPSPMTSIRPVGMMDGNYSVTMGNCTLVLVAFSLFYT